MRHITRREFIHKSILSLGAMGISGLVGGCAPQADSDNPVPSINVPAATAQTNATNVPTVTNQMIATSVPTAIQTVPTVSSSMGAYLAVARGGNDPEVLTRKAIAAIGGMERFVSKGANVVIKPNMCMGVPLEIGATTNPLVVGAVVKMCLEAGAKQVTVLDNPFGGPSAQPYEGCGIAEIVRQAGGVMEVLSNVKFMKTALPDAKRLKTAAIYDTVLKADVLINVPVAKTHSMAQYTLALKNLMGVVQNRAVLHASFAECLPDLNIKVPSTLTVIDAVRLMVKHGPTGGSPDDVKKIDTVIASHDIVAADAYGVTLFGAKPGDIDYISNAAARGLGSLELNSLKIEEINVG